MSEQSPFDLQTQVLRTVYFDIEVNRRLRSVSFTLGIPTSELIRDLVVKGLDDWEASGNRTLAERIDALAAAKAAKGD